MSARRASIVVVLNLLLLLPGCKEDELPGGECQQAHRWEADPVCYVCLATGADEVYGLVRNVEFFNAAEAETHFCAQHIRFWDDVEQVDLEQPVVLEGHTGLTVQPNPGENDNRLVVLDATGAGPLPDDQKVGIGAEDVSCGLVIKTDNVTIERVRVDGYPHGPCICVVADDVILDDVAVTNCGGDGVVFAENARFARIRGFFVSMGNAGAGIHFASGLGNTLQANEGLVLGDNTGGAVKSNKLLSVLLAPPVPAVDAEDNPIADTWTVTGQLYRCLPEELPDCMESGRGSGGVQLHRSLPPDDTDWLTAEHSTFIRYLDNAELDDLGAITIQLNAQVDGQAFFLVAESDEDEPAAASEVFVLE